MPIVVSQSGEFLGLVFNNEYDAKSIPTNMESMTVHMHKQYLIHIGLISSKYSDTRSIDPRAKNFTNSNLNNQVVGFVTKNPQFGSLRIDPDILLVQAQQIKIILSLPYTSFFILQN